MADPEGRNRGALVRLVLGMATFGSATPVSRIVAGAMPPFVGALLRVGLGALVLAPVLRRDPGRLKRLDGRTWWLTVLIAVFGMFGFTVLMLYGMRLVPGVVGAVVMSTAPAVTATASMLFLGDKPTWRKLVAVALAVAGVLVLHLGGDMGGGHAADASATDAGSGDGGGSALLLGSLLVLGAVCCEAAYTLLGKRVSESVDPVLVAFLAAALSVPLFVPFALWQWPEFEAGGIGARAWIALAWYGGGTLSLGTWWWYSGVAKVEGAVAAGFMGVMPCSALVLSYVLLDEPFASHHLAGFGVVLAGVALISWEHARMSRSG